MGEGLLGGLLGEEDEKPEVETTGAAATPQAFAAAVAALASRQDPGVARKTEEFLASQSRLLEVQTEHLKGEYAARLHLLQGQAREVDIRRFGLRLRVAFQLFVALVASAIGIGLAVMVHDAVTSRRVIIEPLHAPEGFPTRGVNGRTIASELLDELARLQSATRSSSAARELSGAWSRDLKLDVPETGISLGEISRLLAERFGHDVHIEGDLTETADGHIVLSVRGNGIPSKALVGPPAELHKLVGDAAAYIYSKSQPTRWATYLSNSGLDAEAVAFCRENFAQISPEERPTLLNTWAIAELNTGGSNSDALILLRRAVQLKPDLWVAHSNILNSLIIEADEEGAWKAGQDLVHAAGGRPGKSPELYFQNLDLLTWNLNGELSALLRDADEHGGIGTLASALAPQVADIQVRLHDFESAQLSLQTTRADPHDPTIAALTHFVRGRIGMEQRDSRLAVTEMEAFGVAMQDRTVASNYPGFLCWIALAEETAGNRDKSDSVLRAGGRFVDCYRFRGDILDGRGDWSGAQKAYADAVALAPDLPAAYYSWGTALERHGEHDTAIAKLQAAHGRGPHWADPLKAWGDALAAQGHTSKAASKYDEALKFAPNWAELKAARDSARRQKT
jgi:hypothetical protein